MTIKLRPWTSNDIEVLAKFANNKNIAKNLTNKFPSPYTIEDARTFIESFNNEIPVKVMAIEVDNKAVGSIGIFQQADIACKNAELGYMLSEEYSVFIKNRVNKMEVACSLLSIYLGFRSDLKNKGSAMRKSKKLY